MTRITVQGLGVVGGFGVGVDALRRALQTGQSPRSTLTVPTGTGPIELAAFRADASALKDFVPVRALRRMDHFSRMGMLAAHLALQDAGLQPAEGTTSRQENLGLIIASGYGATTTTYALLDSIINDGDACTSPTHFANSLHNSCSANLAIALGATGPNLTVSQFDLSVPSALLTARQWLLDGRVERVLFGAVDELSDLIGYSWFRKRGLTRSDPMDPLRFEMESALPGEGAAFLLLSRVDEARPGYCTLEKVDTGTCSGRIELAAGLLLLGADGRKELGARYAAQAGGHSPVCYTPLYGSMPAAPAFDLAVGALLLTEGRTAAHEGDAPPNAVVNLERISCLTLAADDGYGLVELGGIGARIPRPRPHSPEGS
jgi:3-oxoacyl-[acyl-carrier-protein] synthase II